MIRRMSIASIDLWIFSSEFFKDAPVSSRRNVFVFTMKPFTPRIIHFVLYSHVFSGNENTNMFHKMRYMT